jgi:phosphocarrier protein HPr
MTESCDFNLTHISICNKILMNDSCEMNTDLGNYNLMKKGECDMLSKTLTVVNPSGLHLRPAGVLSQTAMKFKCDVLIECGEKRIIAKSVLNVMAAGIKSGTQITLICDGEDEAAAMETISKAIESGLGEM